MLLRVVLAVAEKPVRERIRRLLGRSDVLLETFDSESLLWKRLMRKSCDVVVVSRSLIPDPEPHRVRVLREMPDCPMGVVLSEHGSAAECAAYLAVGIDTMLGLDLSDRQLKAALEGIFEGCRDRAKKMLLSRSRFAEPGFADFVSHSPVMQNFMSVAAKVANSESSLLILGETGVGKERLARAIHAESPRSRGSFVAVNCGAMPDALLESELFGHEEGAFTGAVRAHRGHFELAHGGVIFLDEIGEMPNHLQVKLLRVLQEHEVTRVGSEQPFHIDVRVMAATNRDPVAEVKAGRLRQDLYYRLNVVSLKIPPLRERTDDIPDLVGSYLSWLRPRVGRAVTGIAPEAIGALMRYVWPGNVRELINVIERAMLLCEGDQIRLADLPEAIRAPQFESTSVPDFAAGPAVAGLGHFEKPLFAARREMLDRFEQAYLRHHLSQCRGHIGNTAKRIGIEPRSLFDKMKRYGLRKEDFRP